MPSLVFSGGERIFADLVATAVVLNHVVSLPVALEFEFPQLWWFRLLVGDSPDSFPKMSKIRVISTTVSLQAGGGCSGHGELEPGSNQAVGFTSQIADCIRSSSPISSMMESKTPAATQRRNRRYTVSHLPNTSGKSRQGAPVLQIQIIPSNDMRLSLPFLPGLPGPPGKIGSMRFHCRSLKVRITSKQGHSPHHVAMK